MSKSMQFTTNKEQHMSKETAVESFEDIFKSEGEHCPTCGGEVEVVEKGGKKKMHAKGRGAKKLGNEMDPHKGGKTGSFVSHTRPGSLGGPTNRKNAASNPKPRSGVVKALFPAVERVQLVQYAGLDNDASLAQQIQDSQDPTKPHQLYTPSARNMEMERDGGRPVEE